MHERLNKLDRSTFIIIIGTILLLSPIFYFKKIGGFDFWLWFSLTIIVILSYMALLEKGFLKSTINDFHHLAIKKISIGIFSALILYFLFFAGKILTDIFIQDSFKMISRIYSLGENTSNLRITLLLLFIIGPGEEIIWRGYILKKLIENKPAWIGLVKTTVLYTIVHTGSMNPILLLAAFIGGIFWGILYILFRSIATNIVSHTIWDISVFLLFPFK